MDCYRYSSKAVCLKEDNCIGGVVMLMGAVQYVSGLPNYSHAKTHKTVSK